MSSTLPRIGIFLPRWIGDVVMATPTLRAIRQRYSERAHMVGILRPYVAEVLAGTEWLDDVVYYDRRSSRPGWKGWGLVRRLRQLRLDTMLLLTNSPRTALLGYLSGAGRRIGYQRYGRGLLLTECLHFPGRGWRRQPESAISSYLRLADRLGCDTSDRRLQLEVTAEQQARAEQAWTALGLSASSRPLIGLNTGGAYGAAKSWPEPYFAELARRLVDRLGCRVLVLCGPAEEPAAQRIQLLAARPQVASLGGLPLSIGLTKGCLARCQLLVTTDSGPRHMANALGVPAVTLFGPTDPRWSAHDWPLSIELAQPVPCGPCGKRVCPLEHHRCMRELTVDRVFAAVQDLFKRRDRFRAA